MDVDAQPDSSTTPPGACQPGTKHSIHYYWPDGSLYIRPAGTETIYRVWGSRLERYSLFFADLKSLPPPQPDPSTEQEIDSKHKPTPVEVVKQKAEESGGNGDSETAPLWIQPDAEEFEIFLECCFMELGQDMSTHPVAFWKKAIEMADFFDAQIVRDIAIRWLDENKEFDPFLRLELAIKYRITHWLDIGFRAIVRTHLPDLSSEQINMLGFSAYIILAETQAKIQKHRTLCALTVPPVEHHEYCSGNDSCNKAWAHAWWGEAIKHGVAMALIHPDVMPATKIVKALPDIITSWHMSTHCRTLTIKSLMGLTGLLLKEDRYIKEAVDSLHTL